MALAIDHVEMYRCSCSTKCVDGMKSTYECCQVSTLEC